MLSVQPPAMEPLSCISTLRKLLCASMLRRGDGVIALPDCRRKERLLVGVGRTKLESSVWILHRPKFQDSIRIFNI